MTEIANASCLFCKIIAGQIPAKVAYQDETVFGFHDKIGRAHV